MIANSFFRIELGEVSSQDLVAAAAIAFVDKSWLDSNQVHKWSIQFSRFDENLDAWVTSPSKRIREDEERLRFAVVVPGFSTFAITGNRDLPELPFSISDLRIGPESPKDGEHIDVVASVSNSGAETAVYPAVLWVDGYIEAAKTVSVDAGGDRGSRVRTTKADRHVFDTTRATYHRGERSRSDPPTSRNGRYRPDD
jgi:hypothetical protein